MEQTIWRCGGSGSRLECEVQGRKEVRSGDGRGRGTGMWHKLPRKQQANEPHTVKGIFNREKLHPILSKPQIHRSPSFQNSEVHCVPKCSNGSVKAANGLKASQGRMYDRRDAFIRTGIETVVLCHGGVRIGCTIGPISVGTRLHHDSSKPLVAFRPSLYRRRFLSVSDRTDASRHG